MRSDHFFFCRRRHCNRLLPSKNNVYYKGIFFHPKDSFITQRLPADKFLVKYSFPMRTNTYLGSMPFPVEIDFSTNMTVAPVVAGDGGQQGVMR